MTTLLNLVLLLAMPMQLQTNPAEQNPTKGAYCNERFQFCSNFPSETFPTQLDFNDGDGILLRTENDLATVIIAGYTEVEGENTREVYQHALQELTADGEKPTLISSLFGEDFYECFFIVGKRSFYHKAYLVDGHLVRLSIQTTINQPMLLRTLRQTITLYFPKGEVESTGMSLTGRD